MKYRHETPSLYLATFCGLLFIVGVAYAWDAPVEADQIKNPVPTTPQSVENGKGLFKKHCVVCHGKEGKGDGASSLSLDVEPGDLTAKELKSQSDGALYWKISVGNGHMPNWELILKEKDRWDLVNYIRTLVK